MRSNAFNVWRNWLAGLPPAVPFTVGDSLNSPFVYVTPSMVQGQLQSNKIIGPFAQPVLIDGLRFRAETGASSIAEEALSLRVRVWAGPFSLSNDFIAPAGLSVREQYQGGETKATPTQTLGAAFQCLTNTQINGLGAQYSWHFDEPLYLPAGVPLRLSLKRFSDARDDYFYQPTSNITALLATAASVFGRYFPNGVLPPPGSVPVPYGTTFVDDTIPAAGNPAVSQITSTELDLANQTSSLLYLCRMIGRLPSRVPSSAAYAAIGEYTGPEPLVRITRTYSGGRGPGGYGKDAFARANHRAIVDPMKPFNSVFDVTTRELELHGAEMPPQSAFIATVLKRVNTTALAANIRVFPVFGLVGYRMESWS